MAVPGLLCIYAEKIVVQNVVCNGNVVRIVDFDASNVIHRRMPGVLDGKSLYRDTFNPYGDGFVFFFSINDRMVNTDQSEEHTSELQSRENLVCRLLLEKKKQILHNT